MSFVWKTNTLPKTNSWILKNDGLERVTPFENWQCLVSIRLISGVFCFGSCFRFPLDQKNVEAKQMEGLLNDDYLVPKATYKVPILTKMGNVRGFFIKTYHPRKKTGNSFFWVFQMYVFHMHTCKCIVGNFCHNVA